MSGFVHLGVIVITGFKWKEKDLEDFLESNPGAALPPLPKYPEFNSGWQYETIGRQVKCKGGIIDLLVRAWLDDGITVKNHIYVYELKSVDAKRQDKEQLSRYVKSAQDSMFEVVSATRDFERDLRIVQDYCGSWVTGILIAPSGAPDVLVTNFGRGFTFKWRTLQKPAFSNSQLSDLLSPYIRQNIFYEAGREIGEKITRAREDACLVNVWKN